MNPRWERLIPAPRTLEPLDGFFTWDSDLALLLESGNDADAFAAECLLDACRIRGIPSPVVRRENGAATRIPARTILAGRPDRHEALVRSLRDLGIGTVPSFDTEGYLLCVTSDRVLLDAETAAGIYYAFQTSCRLLPEEGEGGIPAVRIVDSPGLEHRGGSLDFARGAVLTLDAAKAAVREMAAYKLNTLVLYLENAFAFPSHPDAGGPRDRLTPAEARELDAYARLHHVMVIPAVNSPGHMERFLADPRYAHRLRSFGTLCSSWGDRNGFREYNAPLVVLFSEWAWRQNGRPSETLLPAAVESLFGAGTASLAPAIRFLGDIQQFLGWSVIGLESPGYRCFFDPMEPRPLAPRHAALLAEFREGIETARRETEAARPGVHRNEEFLDYLAFAIDQYAAMSEIVACRDGLSRDDPSTGARLPILRRDVADLRERYVDLWHRSRRPLGLEANLSGFRNLERSIPN